MGGLAFANAIAEGHPTLQTPRMKPEDYNRLKEIYSASLTTYFGIGKVYCLPDAPEKETYGDIDFHIVTKDHAAWREMANMLGAAGLIDRGSTKDQKVSLAVRLDGSPVDSPVVEYKIIAKTSHQPSSILSKVAYAQIDIAIVDPDHFAWFFFYASYGDLAAILGAIVRSIGFTVNNSGFYLRMKELDDSKDLAYHNVKAVDGMLLLSDDPNQVMKFLGLSAEEFDKGLETIDAFYQWLGTCRIISEHTLNPTRSTSNERQKERKREVYSRFFKDWLPAHKLDLKPNADDNSCNEDGEGDQDLLISKLTKRRQQLLEEALDAFNKREEYERKHGTLLQKCGNDTAVHLLRPLIAKHSGKTDKHLTEILRSFRRHVGVRDGSPEILSAPHTDDDAELYLLLDETGAALKDEGMMSDWVEEHWEAVRTLERLRAKTS